MYGITPRTPRLFRGRLTGVLWVSLALLVCSPVASFGQSGSVSKKLLRQIGVMEKIIGQVLVDSPNFLVSGRGDVRGTYLEEFGVLLTFEASLVGKDSWGEYDDWRGGYRVETDKNGRTVIILPDGQDEEDWADYDEDDDDDYDDDYDEDDYDDKDDSKRSRSWSSRKNRAERRLYTRGKIELRDTLVDYGDTLSGLKDNQWVAVASFLRDSSFFIDEKISRFILKVKMKDLRAFASGSMDEEELRKRLVEEEY